jgi:WD repeat-containing protein 49
LKKNHLFFSYKLTEELLKKKYEELFENIDVTKTGFVDWNKFTSYMLLMLYETDDRTKAYSIPNWKAEKNIQK